MRKCCHLGGSNICPRHYEWKMMRQMKSPHCTNAWKELPVAH
ncbi:MAG: DUF4113 domain-containing protein [Rickettsiales bacterium]|nr:DUF4113 domain-containing protein [Rickettsiales bacterium]